jgi:predicted nuclease of predicted toxin-antitoxin system
MKLLFDENLSFKLCQRLADAFPDSSQVRLVGHAQADDRALWDYARSNGFILVSQDADFAEMAALFGPPPKVIWLRGGNRPTAAIEQTLRRYAGGIAAFDQDAGAACLEIY